MAESLYLQVILLLSYNGLHSNFNFTQSKMTVSTFLVDSYSKIETEGLQFLRREQKSLHSDCYQDLRDALLERDDDPANVGKRVVFPATFTDGPR